MRPIEDNLRRQGQYVEMPKVENVNFKTCAMCDQFKTCDIVKATARFISQNYNVEKHTEENPEIPFEYTALAEICNFFKYKSGSKAEELLRK